MKRYLILATVLLLFGCKNNPPSPAGMDNDQQELRSSPEYLDLSQYEVPEDDRNAMITPASSSATRGMVWRTIRWRLMIM